jgi:multidrug resistance efflux pump
MKNFKYKSLERIKLKPFVKKYTYISIFIFAVLIGILFLPWQQTVKGEGVLIAYYPSERVYKIYSPIKGFVKEYKINEGEFVKKGDVILEMTPLDKKLIERLNNIKNDTLEQINKLNQQIRVLEEKKKTLQKEKKAGINAYENKILAIKEKIKTLKVKQEALKQEYEVEKANYNRLKILYEEGIESQRKYELSKAKLAKVKAELESIKLQQNIENKNLQITLDEKEKFKNNMESKILDVDKNLKEINVKLKGYAKEIQKINSEIAKVKTTTIKAKDDGYVVRILQNDKNQLVKEGEPILVFAPAVKKRAILLKVNEVDMPLMKEGLKTRIWFYGWPAMQVPGWPQVSFGTFDGIIDKIDPVQYQNNYYYAFVVEDKNNPWPDSKTLKIGTRATVWVRLSTVPMWYEIWRKANALPPIMVNPEKNYQEIIIK